jgi:hypothetical protein
LKEYVMKAWLHHTEGNLSASLPCRFIPEVKASGVNCAESFVVGKASLGVVEKVQFS